jgi:hypothetical protein
MITIACVKSKPYYNRHDVHKLWDMVERNITIPHRFVCWTDDSQGLRCKTKKLPAGLEGWWAKLAMFKEGSMDGKVLYLDLDTLVVDSLDFVGNYSGDFAILRDFYRPEGYGSGVMLWNKLPTHIWKQWSKLQTFHPDGDQGIIEQYVENADRLQDVYPDKFLSYKVHCDKGIPKGCAVVCFHGYPKPEDFDPEHWVQQIWNGQKALAA